MEAQTEPRRKTTSRPRTKAKAAKAKVSPARSASKPKKKAAKAQDPEAAMMAAWQKAMTPAKGHARLEPLVGTFDVKARFWMQPDTPASEGGGKSVQKWILGGRYLQQAYKGTAMGMPFQGVGFTGYDNVLQKYVGSWMDSMGTGIMNNIGIGKPTARKMEFEGTMPDPMTGKNVKLRSVIKIKDNDRNSFEMFAKNPGGKEFRTMLLEYTRK